jgi:hypothetical protein
MFDLLVRSVKTQMDKTELSQDLIKQFPFSVWAVDELEVGLQIMQSVGIKSFMDGTLKSRSMSFWDWHGYMSNTFSNLYPFKALSTMSMIRCLLTYIQP